MSSNHTIPLSYEFFPPKTDKGNTNLKNTQAALSHYSPEFFSVTFGAGGSSQHSTLDAVKDIQLHGDVAAAPHISCIGMTKQTITQLLDTYIELGINRLVTLRGDLLEGMQSPGEFSHAADLIAFIRKKTGDHFTMAAAAYPEVHPESANFLTDFNHFKHKMSAGADFAITQYFYNIEAFLRFRDNCVASGIEQSIMPGIMPIVNFTSLCRFSENCGADIPRWIRQHMTSYAAGSDDQKKLGHDIVVDLLTRLKQEGVDGLHFYTMNQHASVTRLIEDANLL